MKFWDQEIENRCGKQHPLLDKCTAMVRDKLFGPRAMTACLLWESECCALVTCRGLLKKLSIRKCLAFSLSKMYNKGSPHREIFIRKKKKGGTCISNRGFCDPSSHYEKNYLINLGIWIKICHASESRKKEFLRKPNTNIWTFTLWLKTH